MIECHGDGQYVACPNQVPHCHLQASHTLATFFIFFITRGAGLVHALVDAGVVRERRRRGGGAAAEGEGGGAKGGGACASIVGSTAAGVCERSAKGWVVLASGEGGACGSSCLMGIVETAGVAAAWVEAGESSGSSAATRGSL